MTTIPWRNQNYVCLQHLSRHVFFLFSLDWKHEHFTTNRMFCFKTRMQGTLRNPLCNTVTNHSPHTVHGNTLWLEFLLHHGTTQLS